MPSHLPTIILYRHCIDDHNNLRHQTPSFEETWKTHRWPCRVFAFLLAVTEVNIYHSFRYFVWKQSVEECESLHTFRKRLALALINNHYIQGETVKESGKRKSRGVDEHKLVSAPPHAKKFLRGKWVCTNKSPYQQYHCRSPNCTKQVRTSCSCSLGDWMCKDCHMEHIFDVENSDY